MLEWVCNVHIVWCVQCVSVRCICGVYMVLVICCRGVFCVLCAKVFVYLVCVYIWYKPGCAFMCFVSVTCMISWCVCGMGVWVSGVCSVW